jgi:DNA-directed RNA polymerase specialized sigma24 family protein
MVQRIIGMATKHKNRQGQRSSKRPDHRVQGALKRIAEDQALAAEIFDEQVIDPETGALVPVTAPVINLKDLEESGVPAAKIARGKQNTGKLAKTVEANRQRERDCLALRKRGLSFDAIAVKLGINVHTVYTSVARALARITETYRGDVESVRALELERLDFLTRKMLQQMRAENGPEIAIATTQTLLKVMDRRAKLVGLDVAPGTGQTPDVPSVAQYTAGRKDLEKTTAMLTKEELASVAALFQVVIDRSKPSE